MLGLGADEKIPATAWAEVVAMFREALDEAAERRDCRGHHPGPFDRMGETVYCDGSCRGALRVAS